MLKFNVGDKVVFVRENAQRDIDTLAPGTESWLRLVPKGPLTVCSASECVVKVKESSFWFSPDWLKKAEEFKGEVKKEAKLEVKVREGRIKDVVFSGPATIVFWTDGTKTVVKCRKGDKFDPEKGIAMACAKKLLGNEDGYHKEIAKYTKTANKDESGLMDTEKLRNIVSKTCGSFNGCTDCPCRISNGGRCFIISCANREQLSIMYRQFLDAGKLWKEGTNA